VDDEKSVQSPAAGPSVELPRDTQKFLSFAETHRTVLNQVTKILLVFIDLKSTPPPGTPEAHS
jgi:hypothetical protein